MTQGRTNDALCEGIETKADAVAQSDMVARQ